MRAVRVQHGGTRYGGLAEDGAFRVDPAPDLEPIDVIASDGWDALDRMATQRIQSSEARLLAPVSRPGKILCVGLNYWDHVNEQGLEPPERPILFAKMPTAVIGPGDPIPLHPITDQVDYEVELAVVIGRRVRGLSRREALDAVAGTQHRHPRGIVTAVLQALEPLEQYGYYTTLADSPDNATHVKCSVIREPLAVSREP
jgi:2-keto-4-pentenoate hydratase/2-oxohepta-3-ene-1,7-dioic acid hydratase in catechol pathway